MKYVTILAKKLRTYGVRYAFLGHVFSQEARLSQSSRVVTFDVGIINHLNAVKRDYEIISEKLANSVNLDREELATLGKQYSDLQQLVDLIKKRDELQSSILELHGIADEEKRKGSESDSDLITMIATERLKFENDLNLLESEIVSLLTPQDEDDDKNIVLEVRAGTGGDEASLFASEIFKMYSLYCQNVKWKWEELSYSKSEIGGFKEAQASISGSNVYRHLKHEAGVHRVQRIPVNDTKIQTSAASVIIMPDVGEMDINIRTQDIKIDVFRSGGAGGQSVNKTESAVRMTHVPTGVVVSMQDERSQIQNRAKALKVLRARVYALEKSKTLETMSKLRSASHGTGDRSDKIRTYNFPQDRVTDHRIPTTVNGVNSVLQGESLMDIIEPLIEFDRKEKLRKFLESL